MSDLVKILKERMTEREARLPNRTSYCPQTCNRNQLHSRQVSCLSNSTNLIYSIFNSIKCIQSVKKIFLGSVGFWQLIKKSLSFRRIQRLSNPKLALYVSRDDFPRGQFNANKQYLVFIYTFSDFADFLHFQPVCCALVLFPSSLQCVCGIKIYYPHEIQIIPVNIHQF